MKRYIWAIRSAKRTAVDATGWPQMQIVFWSANTATAAPTRKSSSIKSGGTESGEHRFCCITGQKEQSVYAPIYWTCQSAYIETELTRSIMEHSTMQVILKLHCPFSDNWHSQFSKTK